MTLSDGSEGLEPIAAGVGRPACSTRARADRRTAPPRSRSHTAAGDSPCRGCPMRTSRSSARAWPRNPAASSAAAARARSRRPRACGRAKRTRRGRARCRAGPRTPTAKRTGRTRSCWNRTPQAAAATSTGARPPPRLERWQPAASDTTGRCSRKPRGRRVCSAREPPEPRRSARRPGARAGGRLAEARGRVFQILALLLLPGLFVRYAHGNLEGNDFSVYYTAARAVLDGVDPYSVEGTGGRPFVYPLGFAVLLAPLAALPFPVAAVLWTALSLAAVLREPLALPRSARPVPGPGRLDGRGPRAGVQRAHARQRARQRAGQSLGAARPGGLRLAAGARSSCARRRRSLARDRREGDAAPARGLPGRQARVASARGRAGRACGRGSAAPRAGARAARCGGRQPGLGARRGGSRAPEPAPVPARSRSPRPCARHLAARARAPAPHLVAGRVARRRAGVREQRRLVAAQRGARLSRRRAAGAGRRGARPGRAAAARRAPLAARGLDRGGDDGADRAALPEGALRGVAAALRVRGGADPAAGRPRRARLGRCLPRSSSSRPLRVSWASRQRRSRSPGAPTRRPRYGCGPARCTRAGATRERSAEACPRR